ncbi:MAG TPA: DUF4175 family protein, partial [Vicinamibacterales bacterium]
MLPDAGGAGATFEAVLKRLSRRMWFGALLYALAGGLAIAAVLHGSGRGERAWFWNAAATALIAQRLARHRKRPAVAALLERALPDSRNTIVTAEELLRHPDRASERVRDAVVTRAAQLAAPVSPGNVYSLVRPFAVFVAMMALVLTAGQDPARIAGVTEGVRAAVGLPAGVPRLAIAIEPPAYTRLPRVNLVDPERIDALEGSRAVVTIGRDSTRWRLRFGERTIAWDSNGAASLTLNESGYFALEPVAAGDAGSRLVAVAVTPDRAPVVTIDTPARDLVVPNALRDIPVAVSAADDLALASLELRYTKVSGTGED